MRRDVTIIPLNEEELLIISSDNAGGIGEKAEDLVKTDYETLARMTLRVAIMECLSTGAEPISIILHNFSGEKAWDLFVRGCEKLLAELHYENIEISGSSETNFDLLQSNIGITVVGKVQKRKLKIGKTPPDSKIAVIGKPLVGVEVLREESMIAPLTLFLKLIGYAGVYECVPVGSKGILFETNLLFPNRKIEEHHSDISLVKSSGPSTCFIVTYKSIFENEIREIAGNLFFSID
ncbi:ATP-binding protein [Metabacillus arenae]|uniref:ATP-binding protein n=1 Tax=Metabacillus arenae TaxID=2771434 RepID=A0A926NE11_9BACI|nr:ATP-binding protein [Metabacillus arenae]MBD1378703.1 ATP-binding protein [Metabacillus arenae]